MGASGRLAGGERRIDEQHGEHPRRTRRGTKIFFSCVHRHFTDHPTTPFRASKGMPAPATSSPALPAGAPRETPDHARGEPRPPFPRRCKRHRSESTWSLRTRVRPLCVLRVLGGSSRPRWRRRLITPHRQLRVASRQVVKRRPTTSMEDIHKGHEGAAGGAARMAPTDFHLLTRRSRMGSLLNRRRQTRGREGAGWFPPYG